MNASASASASGYLEVNVVALSENDHDDHRGSLRREVSVNVTANENESDYGREHGHDHARGYHRGYDRDYGCDCGRGHGRELRIWVLMEPTVRDYDRASESVNDCSEW